MKNSQEQHELVSAQFSVRIPWSENGEQEKGWLLAITAAMNSDDEEVRRTLANERLIGDLYKSSQGFHHLGFNVTMLEDHLLIDDLGFIAGSNPHHAALFIAEFISRWRPSFAVKLSWSGTTKSNKRMQRTTLIGPDGITHVRKVKARV